jgi:hypothetical protein
VDVFLGNWMLNKYAELHLKEVDKKIWPRWRTKRSAMPRRPRPGSRPIRRCWISGGGKTVDGKDALPAVKAKL